MKVWLVTVVVLFGIVELYQWASHANWLEQIVLLPMPVLFAAGFGLAIASNAKKHLPWQSWPSESGAQVQPSMSSGVRSTAGNAKQEQ